MARYLDPALARAVRESGQIIPQVDVETQDGTLILSTAAPNRNMTVIGGDIDTDGSADIPGSGSIDILVDQATADQVMPYGPRSPLSPVRNAIVYVSYSAPGATVPTPYGAYDIATTAATEDGAGVKLRLTIYDNARRVERAKFFRPFSFANGSSYDAAFFFLLVNVLPKSRITIVPTGEKVGLLSWDVEDNRLTAAVKNMLLMVGYRADWNDNGVGDVWIGPNTPGDAEPVWRFEAGGNCKITKADRELTDEGAHNGIIVSGEATGSDKPPVRAEAWDLDPDSPTYFDPNKPQESEYGPYPDFHTSPFAHTTRQAKAFARSLLPGKMGLVERLKIECFPNPGIKVDDPILVDRERLGTFGTYIVESTSMPLLGSQGFMSIVCRERRLVDSGIA